MLLGNGDGAFQTARQFPGGGEPSSVAVGDFTGDVELADGDERGAEEVEDL